MDKDNFFKNLLLKYLNDDISEEEKEVFFELIATNAYDDILNVDLLHRLRSSSQCEGLEMTESENQLIINKILHTNSSIQPISVRKYFRKPIYIGTIAATLILSIFIWFFFVKYNSTQQAFITNSSVSERLKFENTSDSIQQILLMDNSRIELYPQSVIEYPATFSENERIVYLKGKAFFEIAKDPHSPFVVNSGNLLTKVLGTSFFIHSDLNKGIDEVEVHTGEVQVIENGNSSIRKSFGLKKLNLKPNQKVIYSLSNRNFKRTLISAPQPIQLSNTNVRKKSSFDDFVYEGESLNNIFDDLQRNYGVNINYDDGIAKRCLFTGRLSDSNLFNKLRILCLATSLDYKVNETDIIIIGKGCQ